MGRINHPFREDAGSRGYRIVKPSPAGSTTTTPKSAVSPTTTSGPLPTSTAGRILTPRSTVSPTATAGLLPTTRHVTVTQASGTTPSLTQASGTTSSVTQAPETTPRPLTSAATTAVTLTDEGNVLQTMCGEKRATDMSYLRKTTGKWVYVDDLGEITVDLLVKDDSDFVSHFEPGSASNTEPFELFVKLKYQ